MRIKIKNADIQNLIHPREIEFPKYASQIINRANAVAQGTAPRVVGQMTDLIQEFPGQSFEEWVEWYKSKYPMAIDDATEKIQNMLEQFELVLTQIDREMVRVWV